MISIIVPCYNTQPVLREMLTLVGQEMDKLQIKEYEFILVNDASPNKETLPFLNSLADEFKNVVLVNLGKNTGQANAQIAALNYARGDIIINMDDDMQTHPKNIPILYNKLMEGYDAVWGRYTKKRHNVFRRTLTSMNNVFDKTMLGIPNDIYLTSFWIIRKYVRDEMIKYKGPYSYIGGLILRSSNNKNVINVEIEHFERTQGTSGYNFMSLLKLWSNFTNFTVIPIRLIGIFGILTSAISGIFIIYQFVYNLFFARFPVRLFTVMPVMLFFIGIVLIALALVGEYIGRIYMILNSTPQYIVKDVTKGDK